jgi:hypothetical protein
VAERYTDKLASEEELFEAACAAALSQQGNEVQFTGARAVHAALYAPINAVLYTDRNLQCRGELFVPYDEDALRERTAFASFASVYACFAVSADRAAKNSQAPRQESVEVEYQLQKRILADICGAIMSAEGVAFDELSLRRQEVVRAAKTIYDNGRFDELPELADVLTRAGCRMGEILDHCRGDTEHVRGCWVIDGLLGKR